MENHRSINRRKKQTSKATLSQIAPSTPQPHASIADLSRILGNQRTSDLLASSTLYRDEKPDKAPSDNAEYDEATAKVIKAISETKPVKMIIDRTKQEGAAFATTLHGALLTGSALSLLVSALHVNNMPLPISEVPIPLSKIDDSLTDLELKINYESDGSPLNPEKVMATLIYVPGKASAEKERKKLAEEKREQEIIALRNSNEQFRQMLMSPEEKQREQEMLFKLLQNVLHPTIPDLELSSETADEIKQETPSLLKMRE